MLIVDAIATLLGGALLLRFWMQAIRVRPPASVAQFTFQLSDWLVRPLRRIVPGVGGYDWASLIGAFLIVLLATSVLLLAGLSPQMVALAALQRFLSWILYGFMALLIVEAIFSWVNPHAPLAPFVRALNEPLLRPIRRTVPLVGNLDLSLLVAVILLQIAQILLGMLFSGHF
ncbi:YggT family protein [Pseudoduganella danionis]|uniref:YggT family protein n=2 Tax=Telluria group TaxID=2895353 RepID=A0A845HY53_9BURK|nr:MULTISPECIES: YggT family protein [Telluria group]MTW31508.1 YggT family protein [Pseudoduganella danionis]MYN43826.1 YggT family protein [Duganella fentianensis]